MLKPSVLSVVPSGKEKRSEIPIRVSTGSKASAQSRSSSGAAAGKKISMEAGGDQTTAKKRRFLWIMCSACTWFERFFYSSFLRILVPNRLYCWVTR